MVEICRLPNGCTLYRKENAVGGHRYWSDEVGGGVVIWDTSLVAASTLMAAIVEEMREQHREGVMLQTDPLRVGGDPR